MIALVDYRAGNLTSVRKALRHLGATVTLARRPEALAGAAGIVVPGVGHFGATAALGASWLEALRQAIDDGCPLLGICLGMQWLFDGSDEAPDAPGLGLLAGRCQRLPDAALKVPHVGWNTLAIRGPSRLLGGVPDGAFAYFTHAYAAPVTTDTAATTTYGETFAAAVERGAVAGVQFHPEKSGEAGLQVLANFLELTAGSSGRRLAGSQVR
jgi:glutamine amidotransferase